MNEKTYIYTLQGIDGVIRYVGKTDYPNKRLSQHKCYAVNKNIHLHRWIKKIINDVSISVIDEVPKSNWQFWERWYIGLFKSWGLSLINLTNGGDGTDGYRHTEEDRAKMSKPRRPFFCPSSRMKGKRHKPETLAKFSELNSGINNPMYGKPVPEETRAILRKAKGVKVIVDGIEFDSLRIAAKTLGLNRNTFRKRIKNGMSYENGAWHKL